MITLAIANQKGGVGKTTTAVTLAHGLARQGYNTLLVDLDPQGHVAFALGLDKSPGLHNLIVNGNTTATPARDNLDIIASDKNTEQAKRVLTSMNYREYVLQDRLEAARNYDLVILDMAPSLDVLHVAALVAADLLVIPTKLDALAVDGVNEILRSYGEIARHGNKQAHFYVLPTFFERTTKETKEQLTALVTAFGANVWPPIPQDTKARECTAYGKTLWEYAPTTHALTGHPNGQPSKRVGGYVQTLARLLEVISQ